MLAPANNADWASSYVVVMQLVKPLAGNQYLVGSGNKFGSCLCFLRANDNFNRDVDHSFFVILCGQASEFLGSFFQTLRILFRRFSPPPHLSKKFAGSCTTFANPENSSADLYACRCPHVSISRKRGSYLIPILAFTFVLKAKVKAFYSS